MNPTLETTKVQVNKMSMEFQDDRENDCAAVVTWTYVQEPMKVYTIVTSIHINVAPVNNPQISDCDLIDNAYNFIGAQYRFVDFECRGNVTVKQ